MAHLTTIDMSLELLLGAELSAGVAAGFEVIGISAPGPYVTRIEARGVRHVPVEALTRSWSLRDDLRATRQLFAVLRHLDIDVLHTHTPKAGVLGRVLGRLARVPVVVNTCHGLWIQPEDPRRKQALVVGVEAIAGRFSHAELYQNDQDRLRLRRFVGGDKQRTVGNGIDLERFTADEQQRRRVRAELGVGDADVLVGGVGRQVAEKGIAEFAAAARKLAGRARFVWVGPDDHANPITSSEYGAEVEFLGEREDMAAIYSALDVFALPSHREGFSRSAMEAAACGCAIVVTDIRGCREIGEHEREVLRVGVRDPDALTFALARLLDDVALRERLAESAQARARQAFDQRAVTAASVATYQAVARRKQLDWASEEVVR